MVAVILMVIHPCLPFTWVGWEPYARAGLTFFISVCFLSVLLHLAHSQYYYAPLALSTDSLARTQSVSVTQDKLSLPNYMDQTRANIRATRAEAARLWREGRGEQAKYALRRARIMQAEIAPIEARAKMRWRREQLLAEQKSKYQAKGPEQSHQEYM